MHQKHIKKLNFQSINLNKNSGLLFKYLFLEPNLSVYHINLNNNNLQDEGFEHILDAIKKNLTNDVRVIR